MAFIPGWVNNCIVDVQLTSKDCLFRMLPILNVSKYILSNYSKFKPSKIGGETLFNEYNINGYQFIILKTLTVRLV